MWTLRFTYTCTASLLVIQYVVFTKHLILPQSYKSCFIEVLKGLDSIFVPFSFPSWNFLKKLEWSFSYDKNFIRILAFPVNNLLFVVLSLLEIISKFSQWSFSPRSKQRQWLKEINNVHSPRFYYLLQYPYIISFIKYCKMSIDFTLNRGSSWGVVF